MITNEQLLIRYEKRLEKVKAMWGNDELKGKRYIEFAEAQLEAVKNGGYDGLMKFYEERRIDE